MIKHIGSDDQGNMVLSAEHALIITNAGASKQTTPTQQANPKENKDKPWSPWGTSNKYPQEVLSLIQDVTLVTPILDWKARAIYGGGLTYGVLQVDEKGNETFMQKFDQEIEDWMEETDVQSYLQEASTYFYHFYNIFPEMIKTVDGKSIKYISCLESTDVRWGRRNAKGLIDTAYINPDWAQITKVQDMTVVPVLNTKQGALEQAQNLKSAKFIYPAAYPSPGRSYYQNAPWHVLLKSWLPVAKRIPAFKQALLDQQAAIKYLILVPENWWLWKYPDFNNKTEAERARLVKSEAQRFENFMTGAENAGKSLMITVKDSRQGQEYKDWKIEVIDDKFKEGIYLEDSQEADSHIFKNLNVDPTLFGAGAGKSQSSAGSGSDKRVAWNLYVIMTKPHQDIILKPLHFIAKYNGWAQRLQAKNPNSKFCFWFKNYQIAKLDSGEETSSTN